MLEEWPKHTPISIFALSELYLILSKPVATMMFALVSSASLRSLTSLFSSAMVFLSWTILRRKVLICAPNHENCLYLDKKKWCWKLIRCDNFKIAENYYIILLYSSVMFIESLFHCAIRVSYNPVGDRAILVLFPQSAVINFSTQIILTWLLWLENESWSSKRS